MLSKWKFDKANFKHKNRLYNTEAEIEILDKEYDEYGDKEEIFKISGTLKIELPKNDVTLKRGDHGVLTVKLDSETSSFPIVLMDRINFEEIDRFTRKHSWFFYNVGEPGYDSLELFSVKKKMKLFLIKDYEDVVMSVCLAKNEKEAREIATREHEDCTINITEIDLFSPFFLKIKGEN